MKRGDARQGILGGQLFLTVLKAVKFPAAVAHLDAGLTEVKGKNFSHGFDWKSLCRKLVILC